MIEEEYVVQYKRFHRWDDLSPKHKSFESAEKHLQLIRNESEKNKWKGDWRIIKRVIKETIMKVFSNQ